MDLLETIKGMEAKDPEGALKLAQATREYWEGRALERAELQAAGTLCLVYHWGG